MDRNYIDDHHVIARYLADQLSDTERAQFEAYYLEHPDVVREMEATARLKAGLAALRDSGELGALLESGTRRQDIPALRWAAAAAVVGAIGFLLFASASELRLPVMAGSASGLSGRFGGKLAALHSYEVNRTRAVYDQAIELPARPGTIELSVLPEQVEPSGAYRIALIALHDGLRKEVASVPDLRPEADGRLHVFANSARLKPGLYEIAVAGEGQAESSLRIEVRAAGTDVP